MEHSAVPIREDQSQTPIEVGGTEAAEAVDALVEREPRVQTLIRPAKVITKQGEFVCVVRDVSRSGVRVRLFHKLPDEPQMALQLPNGHQYELRPVRSCEAEAAFEFVDSVDVEQLIDETSAYPKRPLRFVLFFPVTVTANGETWEGVVENFSQQGARIECDGLFAIGQPVRLAGGEGAKAFAEIEARVRWRRDNAYGIVFDDTFSMHDFAKLCVGLQSPMLAAQ
ncbi:MAG: PilZ domain-containing protein [Pseudomonadota bacterium]